MRAINKSDTSASEKLDFISHRQIQSEAEDEVVSFEREVQEMKRWLANLDSKTSRVFTRRLKSYSSEGRLRMTIR